MAGVEYRREQWLGMDEVPQGDVVEVVHAEAEEQPDRGLRFFAAVCALAAAGWVAVAGWSFVTAPPTDLHLALVRLASACSPLILIAALYLIAARTSRRETDRLQRASALLRAEQRRLDGALAGTTERIAAERISIGEHADQLLMIGDDAAHRLRAIGEGLRRDVEVLAREAGEIAQASAQARSDLATLVDGIPQVRAEVDGLVESIDGAGLRAHERAGALDAAVVALAVRARETDDVAGGAAQRLSAHLARVEGTSATATGAIIAATGTMTSAIDGTLAHATQAVDAVRTVVAHQSDAITAIVKQGEAALAKTGAETGARLRERIDTLVEQLSGLGTAIDRQREAGEDTVARLGEGISSVDERLAALAGRAKTQGDDMDAWLARLADRSDATADAFARTGTTADGLVTRAEALLTAVDAVTREIDETMPGAFARLDRTARTSLTTLDVVGPHVEQLAHHAATALSQLEQADAALRRQHHDLAALGESGRIELAAAEDAARALVSVVGRAKADVAETASGARIDLGDAMADVEAGARRAVEGARHALASIAPDVAGRLGDAVRDALTHQVDEDVTARVAALGQTAERAMTAANQASDRLMRQMLTIAETSAQVEARIAEARSEDEDNDRDDYSRRVALLIESLNSTAIDVAKILSNDVGDAAWAAYLKGDRGVFARRAVRLLDATEVREIARRYGDDPAFREQVNRYIRDFEAMLRNVLATRNGSPLGVTLLSSDMGKLYVALAQAIERLRT